MTTWKKMVSTGHVKLTKYAVVLQMIIIVKAYGLWLGGCGFKPQCCTCILTGCMFSNGIN